MRNPFRYVPNFRWVSIRVSAGLVAAAIALAVPIIAALPLAWTPLDISSKPSGEVHSIARELMNRSPAHPVEFRITNTIPLDEARTAFPQIAQLHDEAAAKPQHEKTFVCAALTLVQGTICAFPDNEPRMFSAPVSTDRSVTIDLSVDIRSTVTNSPASKIIAVMFVLGLIFVSLGYREAFEQARERYKQTVWPMNADLSSEDYSHDMTVHTKALTLASLEFIKALGEPHAIIAYWRPN